MKNLVWRHEAKNSPADEIERAAKEAEAEDEEMNGRMHARRLAIIAVLIMGGAVLGFFAAWAYGRYGWPFKS